MQTCVKCQAERPLSDFYKRRYGHRRTCMLCERTAAAVRDKRKLNPEFREKRNAYNKARRTEPSSRLRERRHAARYRSNHPEKDAAKRALNHAIRHGTIIRPDACGRCGVVPPLYADGRSAIHGHHHDYAAPLDVEWLCVTCHSAEHRALAAKPRSE